MAVYASFLGDNCEGLVENVYLILESCNLLLACHHSIPEKYLHVLALLSKGVNLVVHHLSQVSYGILTDLRLAEEFPNP
jgi:hypothetical protein